MSKIIITQTSSQIKCPKRQKDTLLALGLGRIGKSHVLEDTPDLRGQLQKVPHLIEIEELD